MTKCAWLRKTSTSICSSILLNSAPGQIVRRLIFAAVLALAGCHRASDQAAQETPGADPQLLAEINRIQAIDNHAHPVRPAAAGEAPGRDGAGTASRTVPMGTLRGCIHVSAAERRDDP